MALATTTMTMSTMHLSRKKPLDQEIDVFGTTNIGKIRSENHHCDHKTGYVAGDLRRSKLATGH